MITPLARGRNITPNLISCFVAVQQADKIAGQPKAEPSAQQSSASGEQSLSMLPGTGEDRQKENYLCQRRYRSTP